MTSGVGPPGEVIVRQAVGDDWQAWRDVRLRALLDAPTAFGSTYEREARFDEQVWRQRVGLAVDATSLEVGDSGPGVLAWSGDVAVGIGGGFCDLPGWLHIVAMWTDPGWRGRGVGRAVVGHLVAWSRKRGLRVHLDVETGNHGARRLYERCGFAATGETRPLREGSSHEVERMVLTE